MAYSLTAGLLQSSMKQRNLLDGQVDSQNFGILKDNFGEDVSPEAWMLGNLNFDSTIDSQDFGILKDNFGVSVPSSAHMIPEPGTLLLLISGGLCLLAYAWRRRKPVA